MSASFLLSFSLLIYGPRNQFHDCLDQPFMRLKMLLLLLAKLTPKSSMRPPTMKAIRAKIRAKKPLVPKEVAAKATARTNQKGSILSCKPLSISWRRHLIDLISVLSDFIEMLTKGVFLWHKNHFCLSLISVLLSFVP